MGGTELIFDMPVTSRNTAGWLGNGTPFVPYTKKMPKRRRRKWSMDGASEEGQDLDNLRRSLREGFGHPGPRARME